MWGTRQKGRGGALHPKRRSHPAPDIASLHIPKETPAHLFGQLADPDMTQGAQHLTEFRRVHHVALFFSFKARA